MQRRDALRTAGAITLGTITGCASPPPAPVPVLSAPPSPSPSAVPSPLPDEVRHGPRDRGQVALTFHGQGDPGLITALLDALRTGDTHVTILAVGTWLESNHTLARRILSDGHELGNHTQHHADIKSMTPQRKYAEISTCARTLHALTGSIGRWFRPSQTQYATPAIKQAARRAGYPTCLSYDVDPRDYTDPGTTAIVSATLAAARPGSIVSLHCGHEGTVAAIPPLLAGLRARGLHPVTASALLTA